MSQSQPLTASQPKTFSVDRQPDDCDVACKRLRARSVLAAKKARAAVRGFPSLFPVVEAYCAALVVETELGNAHTIAEYGGDDAAIEAADKAWQPSLRHLERVGLALMKHPVTSAAEAVAKHKAFEATKTINAAGEDEDEIHALQKDLRVIAATSAARPDIRGAELPAVGPWADAREAYEAARTAYRLCDHDHDHDNEAPIWLAVTNALELLDDIPAPNLRALAYITREKLDRYCLEWAWHDVDCPNTISDLLAGDADVSILAETYLHLLRLAGSDSPVLSASKFEAYEAPHDDDVDNDARQEAWEAHHVRRRAAAWLKAWNEEGGIAYQTPHLLAYDGRGLLLSCPPVPTLRSQALEADIRDPDKHLAVVAAAPLVEDAKGVVEAMGREVDVITFPDAIKRNSARLIAAE